MLESHAPLDLIVLMLGTNDCKSVYHANENVIGLGIESLLKPLEKVKVPVHEIAMMMSIALRFIPILLEETEVNFQTT